MERAFIAGKPAALDEAIAQAAGLLAGSRQAVIGGLGTDVAGARAAIALAARTGAIVDHMHAQPVLNNLAAARSSGIMLTTATEARVRADTLLIVGPDSEGVLAQFLQKTMRAPLHGGGEARARRAFWLCPGSGAAAKSDIPIRPVGRKVGDLPALLGALRAATAGRPSGNGSVSGRLLGEVAKALKAARFGVAVWSPAAHDPLAIEMLCGLVDDLNATTRFCTLPLAPPDDAIGVLHVCSWLTGLPMRTRLRRGAPRHDQQQHDPDPHDPNPHDDPSLHDDPNLHDDPRLHDAWLHEPWLHDPWLYDCRRLVESKETDCVVWISAYRPEAPPWLDPKTTIALTGADAQFARPPRIHIAVGCPGRDHDGVQYCAATGTLAAVAAARPSTALSVAEVLRGIAAALPATEGARC